MKEKTGVTQTIVERMEHYVFEWCGRVLRMEITDSLRNRRKKKKRKTRDEVGKDSEKSDKAEETNTRRLSKAANMTKND